MHYLYKDFLSGRHSAYLVRLRGFPAHPIAHSDGGTLHGEWTPANNQLG